MKSTGKTNAFYLGLLLLAASLNFGSTSFAAADSALELQQEAQQGIGEGPDNPDLDTPGLANHAVLSVTRPAAASLDGVYNTPFFTSQHATPRPIRAPPAA